MEISTSSPDRSGGEILGGRVFGNLLLPEPDFVRYALVITSYSIHYTKLYDTLIAVMVTLSLNVINGYMGEFSCSHPGFMAIGAYFASVFTVGLFVNDQFFGAGFLPPAWGPFLFPVALILGGFP